MLELIKTLKNTSKRFYNKSTYRNLFFCEFWLNDNGTGWFGNCTGIAHPTHTLPMMGGVMKTPWVLPAKNETKIMQNRAELTEL